jgi:hypothetical protein
VQGGRARSEPPCRQRGSSGTQRALLPPASHAVPPPAAPARPPPRHARAAPCPPSPARAPLRLPRPCPRPCRRRPLHPRPPRPRAAHLQPPCPSNPRATAPPLPRVLALAALPPPRQPSWAPLPRRRLRPEPPRPARVRALPGPSSATHCPPAAPAPAPAPCPPRATRGARPSSCAARHPAPSSCAAHHPTPTVGARPGAPRLSPRSRPRTPAVHCSPGAQQAAPRARPRSGGCAVQQGARARPGQPRRARARVGGRPSQTARRRPRRRPARQARLRGCIVKSLHRAGPLTPRGRGGLGARAGAGLRAGGLGRDRPWRGGRGGRFWPLRRSRRPGSLAAAARPRQTQALRPAAACARAGRASPARRTWAREGEWGASVRSEGGDEVASAEGAGAHRHSLRDAAPVLPSARLFRRARFFAPLRVPSASLLPWRPEGSLPYACSRLHASSPDVCCSMGSAPSPGCHSFSVEPMLRECRSPSYSARPRPCSWSS